MSPQDDHQDQGRKENGSPDAADPTKVLRIALAMRGGVSMAVWIGGAVAELDLLRRASLGVENCGCDDLSACCTSLDERLKRAHLYRRLLRDADYSRVEFDILAGASAGGLNAVLFALAQSYGVTTDAIVQKTWLVDGGIWKLIRDPARGQVTSVLKGDGRLLEVAGKAIAKIMVAGTGAIATTEGSGGSAMTIARAQSVTVELAATLLDDPQQPSIGNRGRFSFGRRPGGLRSRFSTIPGLREQAGALVVDDGRSAGVATAERTCDVPWTLEGRRLALAARASSSFPGAFEPAAVHSVSGGPPEGPCRRNDGTPYAKSPDGTPMSDVVNMVGVFPFARYPAKIESDPEIDRLGRSCERFNVVDGGVFDNIPIDRALGAIQRASSPDRSDRWMVYLDPQPPIPVAPKVLPDDLGFDAAGRPRPQAPSSKPGVLRRRSTTQLDKLSRDVEWLRVIRSGMHLKQRTETASDEVQLITAHNADAASLRGRLKGLGAAMQASNKPLFVPTSRYLEARVDADARQFSVLALQPWDVLCARPVDAQPYPALDAQTSLAVTGWLRKAYGTMSQPRDGTPEVDEARKVFQAGDVGAAMDATKVLIAWVQQLERVQVSESDAEIRRAVKIRLYRCLLVLTEARRLTIDEIVYCVARGTWMTRFSERAGITADPDAVDAVLPAEVLARRDWTERIIRGTALQGNLQLTEVLAAALSSPEVVDDEFYCALAPRDTPSNTGSAVPLLETIQEQLDNCHRQLRQVTPISESTDRDAEPWEASAFAALHSEIYDRITIFEIARIFSVVGVPDTSRNVAYHEITGDQRPRIARPVAGDDASQFAELRHAAIAEVVEKWVRKDINPAQVENSNLRTEMDTAVRLGRADLKLAGTSLARFGGFLNADWRENDWYWGRMDAGAGIVNLLARDAPDDQSGGDTVDDPSEPVTRDTLLVERSIMDESGAARENITRASTESVMDLPPRYRHALVSRLLPLALRGLWPDGKSGGKVSTVLTRVALVCLRPVVVLVALVADPLRLAAAVTVGLLVATFLGAGPTPYWGQMIVAGAMFLAGCGLAFRGWSARCRWIVVEDFLRRPKCPPRQPLYDQEQPASLVADDVVGCRPDTAPCCVEQCESPPVEHDCWVDTVTQAHRSASRYFSLSILLGAALVVGSVWVGVLATIDGWSSDRNRPDFSGHVLALLVSRPSALGVGAEILAAAVAAMIVVLLWLNDRSLSVQRLNATSRPGSGLRRLLGLVLAATVVVWVILAIDRTHQTVARDSTATGLASWDRFNLLNVCICSVAVIALVVLSLWYWAKPAWVIGTAAAAVVVQVVAQWATIFALGANPLLDLLPIVVWLIVVGAAMQLVAPREFTDIDARHEATESVGTPTEDTVSLDADGDSVTNNDDTYPQKSNGETLTTRIGGGR